MYGDLVTDTDTVSVFVACPDCGEEYTSPEHYWAVLDNNGYCLNITCLADLTLLRWPFPPPPSPHRRAL